MKNSVQSPRVAAVVVLYRPPADVVSNMETFAAQVEKVYAVDNTDEPDQQLRSRLARVGNVEYLPQGKNTGVAAALNLAAVRAMAEGFHLLLTMDQDSRATHGMVPKMLQCVAAGNWDDIGIVSPFHAITGCSEPVSSDCEEVLTVMTSGNLLNLAVYAKIGGYSDEFFIDHVDDEYCLRLHAAGYKVVRCNNAVLEHSLGAITSHARRGGTVHISNQSALRRYYITRNRFYLIRKYHGRFPAYCRELLVTLRGEMKGILLFEDDKLRKLWMAWKGYIDYRRGRMGKFDRD